jgi:hypothetical protein
MNVFDQHMHVFGCVIYVNLDDQVLCITEGQKNPLTESWINQHGESGVDTMP